MGQVAETEFVTPLVAAFSRYEQALDWAREQCEAAWGPVELASARFDFAETEYYQPSMGSGLLLELLTFDRWMPADELIDRKLQTNAWEAAYAKLQRHAERRPLNLDAGYLTSAKLVLASTKDHSHRLYLGRGIFAEVTLNYQGGRWVEREWTYPNYRRPDYHEFLTRCRQRLLQRLREEPRA